MMKALYQPDDFTLPELSTELSDSQIEEILANIGFFNPDNYVWSESKKLFVHITTDKTMTSRQMRKLLDAQAEELFLTTSTAVLSEPTNIEREYENFWSMFTVATVAAFVLGSGNVGGVSSDEKLFLESLLREQEGFYSQFGADIKAGKLSQAQIADRFRLYSQSIRGQYEKGRLWAYGKGQLVLPVTPGGVQCGSNCKCHLQIKELGDRWEVRWMRSAKESCPDCVFYGSAWQPYVVYK